MISIIIPSSNPDFQLSAIHKFLGNTTKPIGVIIVVNHERIHKITQVNTNAQFVVTEYQGRGFACYQGLQFARGEIIIFLHDDTLLPPGWADQISNVFNNPDIVGGGFSLTFDRSHWFLEFLIILSNVFFRLTGELWGDRAIFIRSQIIKDHAEFMNVPIMEDVRLSSHMKKKGKVVMLKEKVKTSSETFFRYGILGHTIRIIICRAWYALGGDPERIYRYYYPR